MNAYYELLKNHCSDSNNLVIDGHQVPYPKSPKVQKWIKSIKWAMVQGDGKRCILKPERTKEDELQFLNTLLTINYDEGYGCQELFGTIVFKDGSWLERGEYDGSEWWSYKQTPEEPNWNDFN